MRRCGKTSAGAIETAPVLSSKKKRTNSRWPSMGINYFCDRPDPDDPGGLGAEESRTERTGPTQDFLFAIQKGGRLAEVGRYYDSANDPVTVRFRARPGLRTAGCADSGAAASCSRARLARSCQMYEMTGGAP